MALSRSLMKRTFTLLFVYLALPPVPAMASPPSPAAGDSASVLILSDRVGPVIDADEAKQFHLFMQIDGFQEAIAIRLPDSSLAVLFTIIGPGDSRVDTIYHYSETTLGMLAEKIDHFEALSDGTYKMGSFTPVLRLAGYTVPLYTALPQDTYSRSGIASATKKPAAVRNREAMIIASSLGKTYPREEFYPTFAITLSARSFSPDTKGLEQTLGTGLSYGALISVGAEILFSRIVGIQIEGGTAVTKDEARQATLGPVFYLPLFGDPRIRPFVGAGYTVTSIKGSGNGLLMEGGSKGFYFSTGLQYIFGPAAGLSLYGIYSGFSEESAMFRDYPVSYLENPDGSFTPVTPPGVPASIKFSHLAIGFRFEIFL